MFTHAMYFFFIRINHGGSSRELLFCDNIRGKTADSRVRRETQEVERNDQSRTKSRDIAKLRRRKETTNG